MLKREEKQFLDSCLNKAEEEEMIFVLLARDAAAPFAIRAWTEARVLLGKNNLYDEQIQEALECARVMEAQSLKRKKV